MSVVSFFKLVLCQFNVGLRTGVVVVCCGHSSSVDNRFSEADAVQWAFILFSAIACSLLFAVGAAGVTFSFVASDDVLYVWLSTM